MSTSRARILANYVAGGTSAAEFDYLDGVTSSIQDQLNSKQATVTTGISNTNHLVANANVADNDFLKVDGTSIEGRTAAETLSDIAALPLIGGTMTGDIYMGDDTSIGIADDAERIVFDNAGVISLFTNSLERLCLQNNGDIRLFGIAETGRVRIERHIISCQEDVIANVYLGSSGTGIGWIGPDGEMTNASCASFGFHVSGSGYGNYSRSQTILNSNEMTMPTQQSNYQLLQFTPTAGGSRDYIVVILWLSTQSS